MKNKFFLLMILLVNMSLIYAQNENSKFGKVTEDELKMEYYEQDSSANAVILFDKGFSYFTYDNHLERFKLIFERQVKIKFFKKEGLKYADFKIPLYKADKGGVKEELVTVKGKTYNLENGKIVKAKLENKSIFNEETSKNWDQAKFTFPAVKEGSIIELKYCINSYFYFNLSSWQFQYDIPVEYSEYSAVIPEFFNYNKNISGYDNVNISESSNNREENFTIQYETLPQAGGKVERGTYELPSQSTQYLWKASNIPAFIEEAYITTEEDYMTFLDFELATIQYPRRPIETYTTSWESVNKKLIESSSFGKHLKITKSIQNKADELTSDLTEKADIMLKLYDFVQNNIKWNSYKRKYITDSYNLQKILSNKSGSSADINLLLLMLLKSKQIQVNPIILSTRDYGMIFPTHPTLSGFNYVIVEAKIDDKVYYLDATLDILPVGMLPKRCLNGIGRRVVTAKSEEIKIVPVAKYSKSSMYILKINSSEGISGTVNNSYKGYAALDMRNEIINSGGQEEYSEKIAEESTSEKIEEHKIDGFDDIYKPLKETYNFSTADNITFAGDMIYLTPLLNERLEENPFKLEERKYPVDYAYKIFERLIMQYTVPEGYEIAEMPESINIVLPGKAASFQFQVSSVGNMVQVISNFKINQPIFHYDLYPALKNFYNIVIEKQNQKIVFKKKA
ncbi:MAG: DUF3857 domain-containing protein [Bacteroidales bacterium]|nr:DUF3857 domain-containing protein [Bacteroidales bacterium]